MNTQDHQLKLGTKVPTAIYTTSDEPVCVVDSMEERIDDEAIAERLVACWNACLGMSTKSLNLMTGNYYGAIQHSRKIQAEEQRDELLNALKAALHWIDDNCETTGFESLEEMADAVSRQAVAQLLLGA